jgi:hypothetical protein
MRQPLHGRQEQHDGQQQLQQAAAARPHTSPFSPRQPAASAALVAAGQAGTAAATQRRGSDAGVQDMVRGWADDIERLQPIIPQAASPPAGRMAAAAAAAAAAADAGAHSASDAPPAGSQQPPAQRERQHRFAPHVPPVRHRQGSNGGLGPGDGSLPGGNGGADGGGAAARPALRHSDSGDRQGYQEGGVALGSQRAYTWVRRAPSAVADRGRRGGRGKGRGAPRYGLAASDAEEAGLSAEIDMLRSQAAAH